MRLDLFHEHAAEDIAPGIVWRGANAGSIGCRGEHSGRLRRQECKEAGPRVARKCLRHREPLGTGERTSVAVSTSTKSRAAKSSRNAATIRMRANRNGRRPACKAQNGDAITTLLAPPCQPPSRYENRWRIAARSVWWPRIGGARPIEEPSP